MKRLLMMCIVLMAGVACLGQVVVPRDTLIMNNGNKVPIFFQYENEGSYIVSENLNGEPKMNVAKRMVERLIIVDRDSALAALAIEMQKASAMASRQKESKVTDYVFEGGRHLEKAGNSMFWNVMLSTAGVTVGLYGSITENLPIERLGNFLTLAGTISLAATMVQLRKAGKNLQKQKTLTYHVGPLGGGLAVRF
jgi:hypothetical protein